MADKIDTAANHSLSMLINGDAHADFRHLNNKVYIYYFLFDVTVDEVRW